MGLILAYGTAEDCRTSAAYIWEKQRGMGGASGGFLPWRMGGNKRKAGISQGICLWLSKKWLAPLFRGFHSSLAPTARPGSYAEKPLLRKAFCGFAVHAAKSDYSLRGLRPPNPQGFFDRLKRHKAAFFFLTQIAYRPCSRLARSRSARRWAARRLRRAFSTLREMMRMITNSSRKPPAPQRA